MDDKIKEYQGMVEKVLQRDYFPKKEGWQIESQIITKNNNVKLAGITIQKNKEDKVAPTIYVDDYYKNGYSQEAAAQSIYETYQLTKEERARFQKEDIKSVLSFQKVKDKICYKLINAQKNQELAAHAPHLIVTEDLMLSFYIQYGKDATINIGNQFIDLWGLEKDKAAAQLYELAEANVQRLHPVSIQTMADIMKELMPADAYDEMGEIEEMLEVKTDMYVITNDAKTNGAAVLAYGRGEALQGSLEQISHDLGKPVNGIYIIPSSIHEIIVIPETDNCDVNEMRAMVMDVNRSQVAENDVLSDNVFYYNQTEGLKQLTFSSRERSR